MSKVIPGMVAFLTVLVIAVGGYAAYSITTLNTDLDKAQAEIAALRTSGAEGMKAMKSDLASVESDVTTLEVSANREEEKDNLAADNKKEVERGIDKDRTVALQKDFQVGSWKVGCVVATPNTLNCIGEGFLDGEDAKESYEATVDEDGSFVWKQTY